MTDRYRTLTIILDSEYREDDLENIINALYYTKGVQEVKKGPVTTDDLSIRIAKNELERTLLALLRENK